MYMYMYVEEEKESSPVLFQEIMSCSTMNEKEDNKQA